MQLTKQDGHWCWLGQLGDAHVRFYGRAIAGEEAMILQGLADEGVDSAWLRQRHTRDVVEASGPGARGEGDALMTDLPGLALRIATADCVPVVLVSETTVAAVHAGWRGIAADIVAATLERWPRGDAPRAVIGPAIGGCCYEVGPEVAEQVAAASTTEALVAGRGSRPHLDLQRAVRAQLARVQVDDVETLDACTRCQRDRLWSYRRDGARAGRNLAIVWRS